MGGPLFFDPNTVRYSYLDYRQSLTERLLVTGPSTEPVTVAELRAQTRITRTAEDSLMSAYIAAARRHIETICNVAIHTQTWDLFLNDFPANDELVLPLPPLQSVTSLAYTDIDNVTATWTASGTNLVDSSSVVRAHVNTAFEPGRLVLPWAATGIWPIVMLKTSNPVAVRFVCGLPPYSGAVTVSGGTTVTKTAGSLFNTAWTAGKTIVIGGVMCIIASVTSTTVLTLAAATTNGTNVSYTATDAPDELKLAIMMLAAAWFDSGRTAYVVGNAAAVDGKELPFSVSALIASHRR